MTHRDPKANILLVDDRQASLVALKSALAELGQNLVAVTSGREALRQVLKRDFAAVLLDVHMPTMNGFETAELIRKRRRSRHTPIIFITGYTDELHVSRGYSLGAVDYILAPVVPEVLRAKVNVFVELFKKNQQVAQQAESLRSQAAQLRTLTQASMAIHAAATVDDTLELIAETARSLAPVGHVSVEIDEERGLKPRQAEAGDLAAPQAPVRTVGKRPALSRDTAQGRSSTAPTDERSPRLVIPLNGRDGSEIGRLLVTSTRERSLSPDNRDVLMQLAQIGSIAVENIRSAEAREANRLKDEFLATLSHELRTPLNAMLGWIRLLRTGRPDENMIDNGLQVIERNVDAQSKLIEDLLDISRITSGKLHMTKQETEMRPILQAAIDSIRPTADRRRIALHTDVSGCEARIFGDAHRLQQVASNLLSNAVKFTPEQGRVCVTLETTDEEARIRIQDSGEGIEPDLLPHIFDRFRQADSTSTRAHAGLGVGLAIVRHIVELHGGTVHAESAGAGEGSTFVVRIPLRPADSSASPRDLGRDREARPTTADAVLRGLRVLVVDDDPDTLELLGRIMRGRKADVELTRSAAEALAVVDRWRPDVLISDIAMPDNDGYALIRTLRTRPERRLSNVPAVALTAYAAEKDRQRALEAGFQAHLAKPVEPEALVTVVARIVRQNLEPTAPASKPARR